MIMIIGIMRDKADGEIGEAVSALEGYLRGKGQKMTGPRRTVLGVFLGIERHITAEGLLEAVRKVDPSIGQATVFRTVKLFEEAGLARSACRDEGPRRFEHAYKHEHHDHLICSECGAIVEFADEAIERAQEAIYGKYGFEARDHRLELRGVCPSCLKKAKGSGRKGSSRSGSGGRASARKGKKGGA